LRGLPEKISALLSLEEFVKDARGISDIIVAALLIAIGLVAVAAIGAFVGGLMTFEKAPSAQFAIADAPDDVNKTNANAFIIRHLGGDRIRYDDLILVVYDVDTGEQIYNKVVADDDVNNGGNISKNELKASGYSDTFFEGGEQLVVNNNVISTPGTYEIVLYYRATMQPLADKEVAIT